MTHKDAIEQILKKSGETKTELARRCHYASGTTCIDPRLRSDIKLSTLRNFANALGYEVALMSKDDVYVLDEDIPTKLRCGNNPGGRRGARKRNHAAEEKKADWTLEELLQSFGLEEL